MTIRYLLVYVLINVALLLIGTKGQAFARPTAANLFVPFFSLIVFVPFSIWFHIYNSKNKLCVNNAANISLSIAIFTTILFLLFNFKFLTWFMLFGYWFAFNIILLRIFLKPYYTS